MPDLFNVEIFAVGTWVGSAGPMKWTAEDLLEMVQNTNFMMAETKVDYRIQPKLKFGHDPEQFWEAAVLSDQFDGDPSLGNIANFRIMGTGADTKVVVDFLDVAPIVYDLIRAERYTSVSAEIAFSQGIGWYISAVALLGADTPAVKTLDDLQAFLSESNNAHTLDSLVLHCSNPIIKDRSQVMPDIKPDTGTSTNSTPTPDPALTKLLEDNDELRIAHSQKEKEAAKLKAENEAKEKELAAYRQQNREVLFNQQRDKILAPYKQDVEAKKLMPAVLDKITACLDEQKATFTEDMHLSINPELAREIAQSYTSTLATGGQQGEGGGAFNAIAGTSDAPDEVLVRECKIVMNKYNMTYAQAANHLQLSKPELFKAYHTWTEDVSALGKEKPL